MTSMMRAAVLRNTRELVIEDREVPPMGPNDVKIAVTFNGLCGTDVTEYAKGPMMVPLHSPHPNSGHVGPTVLGHEFIGVVVEAGENASHLLGKRVACGAGISCGTCDRCLENRTNLCQRYFTLGLSVDGGLAEFAVAPAGICIPIPDSVPDSEAVLAQPLAVGIHAVRRSGTVAGQSVAILGLGAIGTFILAALEKVDAHVTAMDVDQARLSLARSLGAEHSVHMDPASHDLRDLRGIHAQGFDVVFEASGAPGMAQVAYDLVRDGGTMVMVGLNKEPQQLQLSSVVLREINTVTTVAHVCADDLPDALALLESKALSPYLVDRVLTLDELVAGGMDDLAAGKFSGKIIVDCQSGAGHGEFLEQAAEDAVLLDT